MDSRFKNATGEKLRGGYYSPAAIADWLCSWAIRDRSDTVLEPSCGDGVFLVSAASCLAQRGATREEIAGQMVGIELLPGEAEKCADRLRAAGFPPSERSVLASDFFEWAANRATGGYHCIVGNPPFIRYHTFPEPSRSRAMAFMERAGLRPNRLTNMWVPFVAVCTELLAPGGRLAMVLPAELLQVSYAAQLRAFLTSQFQTIDIVACNQMLFPGAQQEIVLFLGERAGAGPRRDGDCRIDVRELGSIEDLLRLPPNGPADQRPRKIVNHDSEKWLKYFLDPREIALLRDLRQSGLTSNLALHATVDIGVVTGRNEFFVLSREEVRRYGLEHHCVPLAGRSHLLRGAMFTEAEYAELSLAGERVYLFAFDPLLSPGLSAEAKAYIESGESRGYHKGYKCSIREPWYSVPSTWVPELFLFRQIHDFPRLVLNQAKATSTDTIHRVASRADPPKLLGSYYTHLTAASAEIEGRSYGGGVLELEPTEAERLLIPCPLREGLPPEEIDRLIRSGRLDRVLSAHDRLILREGLGLSERQCRMLQRVWEKLRDRRHNRKKVHREEGS